MKRLGNVLRYLVATGGLVFALSTTSAQSLLATEKPSPPPRDLQSVLDDYIAQGLRYNLAFNNEGLAVEQAQAALQAARAQYLPDVGFAARYTRADGGRSIDFPVGDLLNPVYRTLNDMLVAQGQPAQFPQLENMKIAFVREREQETKLTARQPLYSPALSASVRAQRALLSASAARHLAIARELKRDISLAYYNWLKTQQAVAIVDSSLQLLKENLRVNQSLFDNGKVTEDQPLRARAELLDVEQQLQDARNSSAQARNYVNFLLNRDLDNELEAAQAPATPARIANTDLPTLRQAATSNRAELAQLAETLIAAEQQVRIAQAASRPTLALGVEAGIQGEDYGFGSDYNFATASLLLNWKFDFNGVVRAQVNEARAAARRTELTQRNTARQIELQVQQALDSYRNSLASFDTAQARSEAARAAFRIGSRKRDEGVINQVEFIDVRNTLTQAELNLNLTRFDVLIHQAELEYATGTGSLPMPASAMP